MKKCSEEIIVENYSQELYDYSSEDVKRAWNDVIQKGWTPETHNITEPQHGKKKVVDTLYKGYQNIFHIKIKSKIKWEKYWTRKQLNLGRFPDLGWSIFGKKQYTTG